MTGDTLVCFEEDKLLRLSVNDDWMSKEYFLKLRSPNRMIEVYPAFMPYNAYDPETKCYYIFTSVHEYLDNTLDKQKNCIIKIDSQWQASEIYKATSNHRPFGKAEVGREFVLFSSPSFKDDVCLVVVDKSDNSVFQVKITGFAPSFDSGIQDMPGL